MTASMPVCCKPHTACSRLEPQPKFEPPSRIRTLRYSGRFNTKFSRGRPSVSKRRSYSTPRASPDLSMPSRNCLGMIWSVSRLLIGRGAAIPAITCCSDMTEFLAYVDDVSRDGGRSGHRRAHQMGFAASSLAALEVAIRRRGTALSRLEDVVVHREAHRAARL